MVSLPEKISQIFAGSGASYALTRTGALYGWGWNLYGSVGNGTTDSRETPYRIFKSRVVNVACGWAHAIALFEDGTMEGWGHNNHSQLGIPNAPSNVLKPTRINIPQMEIRCMFCTCYSSAFITSSGDFYFAGQLLADQHPAFAKYADLCCFSVGQTLTQNFTCYLKKRSLTLLYYFLVDSNNNL
jgi:alpha-tubulin suppressor-like RCC1 family protein